DQQVALVVRARRRDHLLGEDVHIGDRRRLERADWLHRPAADPARSLATPRTAEALLPLGHDPDPRQRAAASAVLVRAALLRASVDRAAARAQPRLDAVVIQAPRAALAASP